LSGGEKKRLQLLSILFRNPNFLILDEPTNDLDLPTLSVLEQFLEDYQGCLLIVSHDRYFMDRLVDHLFVFEGDGVVSDFPGNYSLFRVAEKAKEREGVKETAPIIAAEATTKAATTPAPAKRKMSFKEKKEFETIEQEIATLEREKEALTEKLASGTLPYGDIQSVSSRITDITRLQEAKETRWLELSELES
jgi:ABC transport system ATP-binding/permease protein